MNGMKNLALTSAAVLLLSAATAVMAQASADADEGSALTVVELFTSQSCYSCPPAEAFLGDLLERGDVLALEWHIDYWDNLNAGSAGRWKDVFSDPAFTQRQIGYNKSIRGLSRVYTPQMVIGGVEEAVGSRREDVLSKITTVGLRQEPTVTVAASFDGSGGLDIDLGGDAKEPAVVWLVRFDIEHKTKILRGENKGKISSNRHVVRSLEKIGDWQGSAMSLNVADLGLGDNQSCAILVQDEDLGPIMGAAACPRGQSS